MFRESFKYYKSKVPLPDFSDVIDFDQVSPTTKPKFKEVNLIRNDVDHEINTSSSAGIDPPDKWKCYELNERPGLIVIRCPFNTQAQRYWIARCLRDYPKSPNIVNLNENLFPPAVLDDWWHELQLCENKNEARRLKISMRWTTLGYQYNWDAKVYSEEKKAPFPVDLAEICNFFGTNLGFKDFQAEAAIVNYYPIGTTLAGHTDHSEQNLDAPLFSFSFGQTAIFLIGGESQDEKPTAIFLRSGDVLIMSRASRVCYHAVPRIMKATEEPWNSHVPYKKPYYSAINYPKRLHCDSDYLKNEDINLYDHHLYEKVCDEDFWQPFKNYLNDSRININVRQVLKEGDLSL